MAFVLADQLRHVTQSRIQRIRPNRARSILPVDGSVPDWATEIEHSEISMSSTDPVRIGNGSPKNLPSPTIQKSAAYIQVISFGYSYRYTDQEMAKVAKLGTNLPATLAIANQNSAERFIDEIAAGEHLADYGLPGLLNIAGHAVNTASAKAGGGTTWAVATFDEIVSDVASSIEAVDTNTLQTMAAGMVILAPASYWLLTRRLHPTSSRSALSMLQEMFPGVRFVSWNRCSLADQAGTGPRMVTMATGEDVARLIIPTELTDDQPIRVPFGVEIAQRFSTAGVLVETPLAIVYTDGL